MALYQKHNNHKTFSLTYGEVRRSRNFLLCPAKEHQPKGFYVVCGRARRVQRFVGLRLYKHVEIDGINGSVVTFESQNQNEA